MKTKVLLLALLSGFVFSVTAQVYLYCWWRECFIW